MSAPAPNTNITPFTPAGEEPAKLSVMLKQPGYAKRFEAVLGERAPQFISSLISVGNSMRDVEPRSIIGSAMQAAALDLPIERSLGFAWIVPYKKWDPRTRTETKLAQFQVGWKGYVQLAQRSGKYSGMNAVAINKEAYKGRNEIGEPVIDWEAVDPTKDVFGYVFAFKSITGYTKVAMWTKEKVMEHAKRYSQSFRSEKETPWKTHFDEMALKTVISNELRRWGILSVQMQQAEKFDQAVIADVDADPVYVDNEEDDGQPRKPSFESRTAPAVIESPADQQSPDEGDLGPQTQPQTQTVTNEMPGHPPTEVAQPVSPTPKRRGRPPGLGRTTEGQQPGLPEIAGVQATAPLGQPVQPTQPAAPQPQAAHPVVPQAGTAPEKQDHQVDRPALPPAPKVSAPDPAKVKTILAGLEESGLTEADLITWANGSGVVPGATSLSAMSEQKVTILAAQLVMVIRATKQWKEKHP